MSAFTPSKYQVAIFDWITNGSGNAIVDAVAGSGKTSTLVEAAKLLKGKQAIFLAFNKHIQQELERRLLGTGMSTSTIHSIGNSVLGKQLGKRTDPSKGTSKWREIVKEQVEIIAPKPGREFQVERTLQALISKTMVTLTEPHNLDALWDLVAHFGIEDASLAILKRIAPAIEQGEKITKATGQINFDEMVYWPVRWNLQPPQFEFVMVDEAQDLNAMQREIALRCVCSDGRLIAVGDERQAIYGFSGADAQSFKTIQERTSAVKLPLSVNYRCPKSHLALVRDIVPHIEDGPNAIEGTVEYRAEDEIYTLATTGDYAICRITAPLVSICIKFIQRRKSARVLGRDIGKDLCSLLDKIGERDGFTYASLVEYLDRYEHEQVRNLSQREGNEQKIQSLQDRVECLTICAAEFADCHDLDCLKMEIEKLFGDEADVFSGVTLSTVHKAKGLEADRIFVIKPEKLPLAWPNQSAWQHEQELNVRYIALTRAKKHLTILGALPNIGKPIPLPLPEPIIDEPPMARLINSRGVDIETGEVVEPKPEPAPIGPQVTGNLKADLQAFSETPAVKSEPLTVQDDSGKDDVEISPVVVTPPRRTLAEIVDSLSVAEIDRMIEVLSAAREKKVAEHA